MNITKKFIRLRTENAIKIYTLMKRATVTAAPVNAPLWWADPDDPITHTIDSGMYVVLTKRWCMYKGGGGTVPSGGNTITIVFNTNICQEM